MYCLQRKLSSTQFLHLGSMGSLDESDGENQLSTTLTVSAATKLIYSEAQILPTKPVLTSGTIGMPITTTLTTSGWLS